MSSRVASFIARQWRVPESSLRVDIQPLHGGLESSVSRARITRADIRDVNPTHIVIKELGTASEREAAIYSLLWRYMERPPALRVLGSDATGNGTCLFLEYAQSLSLWPWRDTELAARVCRELARFHDAAGLPHQLSNGTTRLRSRGLQKRHWKRPKLREIRLRGGIGDEWVICDALSRRCRKFGHAFSPVR